MPLAFKGGRGEQPLLQTNNIRKPPVAGEEGRRPTGQATGVMTLIGTARMMERKTQRRHASRDTKFQGLILLLLQ
jgi:hypothetical protein